ncbi:MAG: DUF2268 domain-containing putative Zn-dependent protease [Cyclobacteriaceae bacterium]
MIKSYSLLIIALITNIMVFGQTGQFTDDPYQVSFVTSDLPKFWAAFDSLSVAERNPFETYIGQGSAGVKGFVPYRIINADSLRSMVLQRKKDYEAVRGMEEQIKQKVQEIKPYFYGFKYWYPEAIFPPVYFVMGRFNSGGTTSEEGLIIGVEKLTDLNGLPSLIIHESVHFQQKWPEHETTLLEHAILEGSADFLAELITGIKAGGASNEAYAYGEIHKDQLCREFVARMSEPDIKDWLYGTSGKDDRPNDLGYWMGYNIVQTYFDQVDDKRQAVQHILNLEDFDAFLQESGFLAIYQETVIEKP